MNSKIKKMVLDYSDYITTLAEKPGPWFWLHIAFCVAAGLAVTLGPLVLASWLIVWLVP